MIIVKYNKKGGMNVIADKIKTLREKKGDTQSALANSLGSTRSAVNAWEMGITVPSTQYVVELAKYFNVSTDYLLDLPDTATISVEGLTEREIASLVEIIQCYKKRNISDEG